MSSRRQPLILVFGVAFFAISFGASPARAQLTGTAGATATGTATITIYNEQSLPRYNAGHSRQITKRALQYTPEGVNFEDCLENQEIEFPIQMNGFTAGGTVQAWASLNGTDCSVQTARTGGYQLCWHLPNADFQPTISTTVWIPVRSIMSGASPNSPIAPVADQSVCGLVDLNTVQVQFLYFAPGNLTQAAGSQAVTISVDTVGPAPPSGLHTLPGDTRIYVDWDSISGEGGLTALTGVKVYCDDNGNTTIPNVSSCQKVLDSGIPSVDLSEVGEAGTTTPVTTDDASTVHSNERADCVTSVDDSGATITDCGDAGDGGDAGAGSSIVTVTSDTNSGTCSSNNLVPTNGNAVVPNNDFDSCFLCGSITGNTGTQITASGFRGTPLANDKHYAVAVAATDAFENVGQLSPIICEFPELTNDFWRTYKDEGGGAGGCGTTGDATPFGSLGAIGALLALGFSFVRRRRKGSR